MGQCLSSSLEDSITPIVTHLSDDGNHNEQLSTNYKIFNCSVADLISFVFIRQIERDYFEVENTLIPLYLSDYQIILS